MFLFYNIFNSEHYFSVDETAEFLRNDSNFSKVLKPMIIVSKIFFVSEKKPGRGVIKI